jgi:predicted nucleic acid-binding protein
MRVGFERLGAQQVTGTCAQRVGRQSAVRPADSLHLASAALADARAFITYDRQQYEAALALVSFEVFGGR